MTFRLADPDALYRTTVAVDVPAEDGFERRECIVLFRLITRPEAAAALLKGDEAYMRAAVGGWEGIADHDGSALEFSDENLVKLAGISYFARAVQEEHERFLLGLPGKTSRQPSATGGTAPAPATQ
ncbi:MAG: hypothetical protein F4X59_01165 [Holophagales bacterium]|nr:hypothetical protein [Holophagales bacterium]MYC08717.1 hypothetical protein [Holophagales bacterium]